MQTTPIIVLTSAGRPGDGSRCRQLGVEGYLTKPVMSSELLGAIRAVLGHEVHAGDRALVTRHSLREDRSRLHVLIAEDSPVIRDLVVRTLDKRGYYVRAVDSGRAALEALGRESFQLLITDLKMPEMDGFELVAAVRRGEHSGARRIPVVALTAGAEADDRDRCLAAGMDAYVSKPFKPEEFIAVVDRVMSGASHDPTRAPDATLVSLVLDRIAMLEHAGGEFELLARVIQLHQQEAPRLLDDVCEALARSDHEAVERAAHRLKGNLSTLGAQTAAEIAARLEQLGADAALDQAPDALATLRQEMERVAPELEAVLEAGAKTRMPAPLVVQAQSRI